MFALLWLALETLTLTIGGKPVAFVRATETGPTVSATCRRAGRFSCQAFAALASASRRSAESSRHGVGTIDCADFQAARVDPAERQPLCRFGDGSMIRLEDLERWAQAKDDWERAIADPVTRHLPRLTACLARVQYAAVGTLRVTTAIDTTGRLQKPQVERPKSRGADWPVAQKCLLAALGELRVDAPPGFTVPSVDLDLLLGGEPRVEHIAVHWKLQAR